MSIIRRPSELRILYYLNIHNVYTQTHMNVYNSFFATIIIVMLFFDFRKQK